jgi:16S rRNA (cytidine1402-2'-O)-methyltransferase
MRRVHYNEVPRMSALKPTSSDSFGELFLVATPIGNLGDVSARARQTLSDVAVVAAEDTRHSGQLLQHLGLAKPLVSLHEHNEAQRADSLVTRLKQGESIALVSDAGTPLISDPGYDLVRAALAQGIRVIPIPGACAAIVALSAAGLPTDRFAFEGFLPAKASGRRERLDTLCKDERTLIFYEAPHRLTDMLADIATVFGDRRVVVARELTKQYETFYYGTAQELALRATQDADMNRGEIVVVVAGSPAMARQATAMDADKVLRTLLEELSPAQAAKLTAKLTGEKRSELYDRAVTLSAHAGRGK